MNGTQNKDMNGHGKWQCWIGIHEIGNSTLQTGHVPWLFVKLPEGSSHCNSERFDCGLLTLHIHGETLVMTPITIPASSNWTSMGFSRGVLQLWPRIPSKNQPFWWTSVRSASWTRHGPDAGGGLPLKASDWKRLPPKLKKRRRYTAYCSVNIMLSSHNHTPMIVGGTYQLVRVGPKTCFARKSVHPL